ncbi:hypothetical protein ACG7TL_001516 [Trametes sanguinea]
MPVEYICTAPRSLTNPSVLEPRPHGRPLHFGAQEEIAESVHPATQATCGSDSQSARGRASFFGYPGTGSLQIDRHNGVTPSVPSPRSGSLTRGECTTARVDGTLPGNRTSACPPGHLVHISDPTPQFVVEGSLPMTHPFSPDSVAEVVTSGVLNAQPELERRSVGYYYTMFGGPMPSEIRARAGWSLLSANASEFLKHGDGSLKIFPWLQSSWHH